MFLFSFTLILLIAVGVNSQTKDINAPSLNNIKKASLFGQFHQLIDNQNPDQTPPISCYRVRPNIKNAHPTDNTKYFICRSENYYEISTCPNGGIFDNNEKACIDLCQQKNPCLNQGQCIILSNLTLQCVCRRDWTGEHCEIPLSTCANNPCGPKNECRMLKAHDYSQDYVCICNHHRSYGRNCEQTVPNPCLMNLQQFHPFAYSRHAYINCDDELIFFQACNAKLYWNQEDKRCDRTLPLLLRAPFINIRPKNQQTSPQWQMMNENQQQQQQNFPTVSQGLSTQPWSNQVQNNQRFVIQSQARQGSQMFPNQQSLTNQFIETTTSVPSKVFHLSGFSAPNPQPSNNANNQIQSSTNVQSQTWPSLQSLTNQPLLKGQNLQQLTTDRNTQTQMPIQQNNQLGLNQQVQNSNSQSDDWMTRSNNPNFPAQSQTNQLPTTTVDNKGIQQGMPVFSLRGWKSKRSAASN